MNFQSGEHATTNSNKILTMNMTELTQYSMNGTPHSTQLGICNTDIGGIIKFVRTRKILIEN